MSDEIEPSPIAVAKAGFEFNGEQLHPYTPSRKVAAQAMGMIYPYVGEAGSKQIDSTGQYAGMLKDIVILFWICSQKDAIDLTKEEIKARTWTPSRAMSNPEAALKEALAWAEINGVSDVYSELYNEAEKLFGKITAPPENAKFKTDAQVSDADDGSPKV